MDISKSRPTTLLLLLITGFVLVTSYLIYQRDLSPSSKSVTTSVSSRQQFEMLSYNFQVNKSVSSLFVVVKNYGNRSVSVSEVTFDGVLVDGSRVTLDNGCVDFASGSECGITLLLGPPSQPLSVEGSGHSIVIIMRDGTQLSYQVTAGELYHAACTYTSSC